MTFIVQQRRAIRRRGLGDDSLVLDTSPASTNLSLDTSSLQNNPSLTTDTSLYAIQNPLDVTSWFGNQTTYKVSNSSYPTPAPFSAPPGGVPAAALNTVGLGSVGTGTWVAVAVVGALMFVLILKR